MIIVIAVFVAVSIVVVGNVVRNGVVCVVFGVPLALMVLISWANRYPVLSAVEMWLGAGLSLGTVGWLLRYAMSKPRVDVSGTLGRWRRRRVRRSRVRRRVQYAAEVERV